MDYDIYDFDKTIVPFESATEFLKHCLLKYPYIIIYLPVILVAGILNLTKIISLETFKRFYFGFVKLIPLKKAVCSFWDKKEKYVNTWFLNRKRKCVVISASPEFLLCEIAKRLNFDYLICTKYDLKSLKVIGKNCRDEEKVVRLNKELKNINVCDVYSDSLKHDKAIFSLAKDKCYNVVDKKLVPFDFKEKYGE